MKQCSAGCSRQTPRFATIVCFLAKLSAYHQDWQSLFLSMLHGINMNEKKHETLTSFLSNFSGAYTNDEKIISQ